MTITSVYEKEAGGNRGRSGEKGFTLMEVLIAMTILSVGLLAIASMQISAIQVTGGAKSISKGATWAEDRLEMLSSLSYADTLLNDTAGGVTNDPNSPPHYTITWSVDDDNPRANCKLITVFVRWNERGNVKTTTMTGVKPQF